MFLPNHLKQLEVSYSGDTRGELEKMEIKEGFIVEIY